MTDTETSRSDDGNQPEHFFASSAFRYQRGRTREAAIQNLLAATPTAELRNAIMMQGGLLIRTWLVNADMVVRYTVGPDMAPVGVDVSDLITYRVIALNGRRVEV